MSGKVAEIKNIIDRNRLAVEIANLFDNWNVQRRQWLSEKKELRNYIFATDTTKTSNAKLPWKNKTTIPKICQIRDNLHANYMSALFPNDEWLKWEGYDMDSETTAKKKAIQAYMSNKLRESGFRETVGQLLYDYIDWGIAIADVEYVSEYKEDKEEKIAGYVGPKARRISPFDIVFNPVAPSFRESPKITRYIKTIGELEYEALTRPELKYNVEIIKKAKQVRTALANFREPDVDKAEGFMIDGFGALSEYYQSDYVEILEFEGNLHDPDTGAFYKNYVITVIDRSYVIRKEPLPNWFPYDYKVFTGWRPRPDNLYAMGPLDNLVGMQYRLDHLENLKADAMDLAVHPPLVLKGNVEEFVYAPGAEIIVDEEGDVAELGKNLNGVIAAQSEMEVLENRMEEMAGAPKQAMGIRTPGEKTAYEVQSLENASYRIFQSKITNFEINVLEPLLNNMLEIARRQMDAADVVRVMDDDLGVADFLTVAKEDITAKGKLRPIGARHFAARAQLAQNLMGFFNSQPGNDPAVMNHISGKAMAKLFEDLFGVEKYQLVKDNIRIIEQVESQRLIQQAQENLEVESQTPIE